MIHEAKAVAITDALYDFLVMNEVNVVRPRNRRNRPTKGSCHRLIVQGKPVHVVVRLDHFKVHIMVKKRREVSFDLADSHCFEDVKDFINGS